MKKFWLITALLAILSVWAQTVKLSDYKPTPENASAALQAAINSPADTVIIDNPGYDLIIHKQINLKDNLTLIFEDGVKLIAAKGRFTGLGEFMFKASGKSNITMLGKGKAVIQMRKSDYQNPKLYRHSEWRHMIGLYGVSNVRIANLELRESGGDGIYLGTTTQQKYCKDVTLENLVIDGHHRQGISVISAENLIIRDCRISNTSGTAPAAGIDFEPNSTPAPQRLVNCLVENCQIYGNAGAGIECYTVYMEGGAPAQSITIRNCTISGNREGISVFTSFHRKKRENIAPPSGFIQFEKCRFENNRDAELLIRDNLDTVALNFIDCTLKNSKTSVPIMLVIESMTGGKIGNINFGNLQISSDSKELFAFKSWTDAQISTITGKITVSSANGISDFDLQRRVQEIRNEITRRNQQQFVKAIYGPKSFVPGTDENAVDFNGELLLRGVYTCIISGQGTLSADYVVPRRDIMISFSDSEKNNCYCETISRKNAHLKKEVTPRGSAYATVSTGGGVIKWHYTGAIGFSGEKMLLTKCNAKFAVMKDAGGFEFLIAGQFRRPVKYRIINENGTVIASGSVEEPEIVRIKTLPGQRKVYTMQLDITDTAMLTLGRGTEGLLSSGKLPVHVKSAK